MTYYKGFIFFLLFILSFPLLGQDKSDSIKNSLKNPKLNDSTRLKLINRLVFDVYLNSNIDSSLKYANIQLKFAKKARLKKEEAQAYNNLGLAYSRLDSFAIALNNFNNGIQVRKEINDRIGIAKGYGNISNLHKRFGNNSLALNYSFKSLKILEEAKLEKDVAIVLLNISSIYFGMNDLKNGVEYCKKSLKIFNKINYHKGVATCLGSISLYEKEIGNTDSALYYIKLSGKSLEKLNDDKALAVYYSNLGSTYIALDSFDIGINYIKLSVEMSKKVKSNSDIIRSLTYLGDAYLAYGNFVREKGNVSLSFEYYKKAILYCEEAISTLKSNKPSDKLRTVYELLYKIYKRMNRVDKALEYHELFKTVNDSLDNTEQRKIIMKQQLKYDYEKQALADSINYSKATELKNIELEKQKAEIRTKRSQQYALIIGLFLVALFSLLIFKRYKITKKQKIIIEKQRDIVEQKNHIIEDKQKEIIDSIKYAKLIQNTLLAHKDVLIKNIPSHFVFFNPKDIVSGDFYWATVKSGKFYFAICDSTGHGVPGAFMSLLNISFLNEAITEKNIEKPNEIFDFVRNRLTQNIGKEGQKDGFDGVLVCVDEITNKITYAAANNPPLLISAGKYIELEYDRMPVGIGERNTPFTLHEIEIKSEDTFYVYTDGYADQFGGEKGKKFKYKKLNELLLSNYNLSMEMQSKELERVFNEWKGDLEQVDDVCICAFKLKS